MQSRSRWRTPVGGSVGQEQLAIGKLDWLRQTRLLNHRTGGMRRVHLMP